MNLRFTRDRAHAQPVYVCPRCVVTLRERDFTRRRCRNCGLAIAPRTACPEPPLGAGSIHILTHAPETPTPAAATDVFDAIELDPDDDAAQAWVERARAERAADQDRIAALEAQLSELAGERDDLLGFVAYLLQRSAAAPAALAAQSAR